MNDDPDGGADERFGVRHGIEQKVPQDRHMAHRLRNDLWNVFYMHWPYDDEVRASIWADWAEMTLDDFDQKERIDRHTPNHDNVLLVLKMKYWKIPDNEHYRIYELVETVCGGPEASRRRDFVRDINAMLAENLSVYRLAKCRLERTMSDLENDSVKKAAGLSAKSGKHVEKALKHMGPTSPDYEASISESVKMVEHTAQKLGGTGRGLNSLVRDVSKRLGLHPVMQGQFAQMYGFANRTARHSEAGEEYTPDSDDAMVMLVWCAAMANYLVDKDAAAGSARAGSPGRKRAAGSAPSGGNPNSPSPQTPAGKAAAAERAAGRQGQEAQAVGSPAGARSYGRTGRYALHSWAFHLLCR